MKEILVASGRTTVCTAGRSESRNTQASDYLDFCKPSSVSWEIVQLFFYRDLNQNQIATTLGLSPKRVSRMMRKALDRLGSFMRLKEGEPEEDG